MDDPPASQEAEETVDETDLISARAEIFRSQLITDFHLLESISEGGSRIEAPNLYTTDITDQEKMKKMMLNRPQGLVRFHIYDKLNSKFSSAERRRNRLKNKRRRNPPVDLWANYIITSEWFNHYILFVILLNSLILGLQAEFPVMTGEGLTSTTLSSFMMFMDVLDYISLMSFICEIILKWLDNFKAFWYNGWNVFDFLVTIITLVPEFIKFSGIVLKSDVAIMADTLRTFRVIRTLKMVTRFEKIRLVVLSVTKAFQEMVFITILLILAMYLLAIFGVTLFNYEGYEEQVYFKHAFKNFLYTMVTLFQLFTLDHWYQVFEDVQLVSPGFSTLAGLYVIVWIIIGSFIIKNIVVGIMVNNFQSIRNELFLEVGEIEEREQRDREMADFAIELDKQNTKRPQDDGDFDVEDAKVEYQDTMFNTDYQLPTQPSAELPMKDAEPPTNKSVAEDFETKLHATRSKFASKEGLRDAMEENVNKVERESEAWQLIVEHNIENLAKEETSFCWPKDSLFKYYLMMESLMENIKERQELLSMANECLTWMQDK